MKVNISNIIVSINKNQDKEIYRELGKNGISRDNIENLKYLKKSIDSRKKNDIKFIYTLEITLKKSINLEKYSKLNLSKEEMATQALSIMEDRPHQINVLPVFDKEKFVGVIRIHDLLKVR